MGIFDPKIVKWYKNLVDCIKRFDAEKVAALLSDEKFKSAIDFKTGALTNAAYARIQAGLDRWDWLNYSERNIGCLLIREAGVLSGSPVFEKFFIPEATAEAKAEYLRAVANDYNCKKAEFMLRHGANPDAQGYEGQTALHIAAKAGRADTVSCLIASGADPRIKDKKMNTPADFADAEKHHGIANYLREEMAKYSAKEKKEAEQAGDWRLVSKHEIASVAQKPEIGYRITGIFNFASGLYTQIATNTASGQESQCVTRFDALEPSEMVDEARRQLLDKGGEMPANAQTPVKKAVLVQTALQ